MYLHKLLGTAAGALAIATGAGAVQPMQAQDAEADFRADSAFVRQVAAANLLEVRLGQMAEKKAETSAAEQFGARMANEHTNMQRELMLLARRHDFPFHARWTPEQEREVEQLNQLSGREFDRAYMDLMVQEHLQDLNLFQTQGRSARSAAVREFANRGSQVLREHYNLATQVRSQVGGEVAINPDTPGRRTTPEQQPPPGQTTPWENVKRDAPTRTPTPQDTLTDPGDTNRASERDDSRSTAGIRADAQFIRDVGAHHFLEQRLGELAARRADNASVRQYGRKMAEEHGEMEDRWIEMARSNGMSLGPGMGPDHRAKLTRLEKRSGRAFDREYMSLMVSNHKGYLNAFQKEGQVAESEAVRKLVDREIPRMMEHFNLAKRVGARVNADTAATLRATSLR